MLYINQLVNIESGDHLITIFDYKDYRKYVEMKLPITGAKRGVRTRLAMALSCQTAFISRVLHEEAHFSLEHAVVINRFLIHTDEESNFFILMIQYT